MQSKALAAGDIQRLAEAGYLYALIDSTDLRQVPAKLNQLPESAASLFNGTSYEEYWAVAPYLAKVDPELLQWIEAELGSEPWGVFLVTNQPFEVVAAHCRDQLFTILGDGQTWYFRYYDPRVLEREFSENTARNWSAFFGPVRAFVVIFGEAGGTSYMLG